MLDIPSISVVVAATSVVIGVINSIISSRKADSQRETEVMTRQAQLFMQVFDHYYREDFLEDENEILFEWKWKDFDDFWKKYGPETNSEAFNKWDSMGTYFRGIGVLVKRKLIDLNLVNELMGTSIILHWEKSGPVMKQFRDRYWPHAYEWFEYLYNEMKKRQ